MGANGLRFNPAELLFAARVEDLGNGSSLLRFDLFIEVGKIPAELFGEQTADGRFARSHEAGQVDAGRAF